MRLVSSATTAAWRSGGYVGGQRAVQRATIQKLSVAFINYDLATVDYSMLTGTGVFSTIPFGQADQPVELPNLKSIKWDRNVDQDVATCTIELYNVAPLPLGQAAPNPEDFEQPGFYTPDRGKTAASARWGYQSNGWADLLVPDRLIRTYEGYGADWLSPPETDPNLYQSGTWLIDDVTLSAFGVITIHCRDIGRALLDQVHLPPVIPWNQYPLSWTRYFSVKNPDTYDTSPAAGWFRPTYRTDSNIPYIGTGITDGGRTYVSSDGSVYGHHGKDAFDTSNSTYWLSVGNRPDWSSAYEYVEGKFSSRTIAAVRVKAWAGPYTMYVSVYADGKWQGASTIPYRFRQIDTNADIRFVKKVTISKDQDLVVKLPKAYAGATKVRVTFSHLYNSGLGVNYKYRAGVRDFEVLQNTTVTTVIDNGSHTEGNYGDYTDIVKWLCAWGGFYWPLAATNLAYLTYSDNAKVTVAPSSSDPILPSGRVWGDFEQTGTNGPATLTVDIFDKKPLMDGINYVKEIIGFNFFIDEGGGVVWRSPNIWSVGNYIHPEAGGPNTGRTTSVVTIDEKQTIADLTAQLSSRNVRERVFVANTTGKIGAVASGYNPYPSGLRRVGGWTDQRFATEAECQIMADLITVRQGFAYRTDTITIPGNPAIQNNDQVRIYERVTNEGYLHYVKGISSEWDAATGRWTYTLDTHWLGETPFSRWAFDPTQLAAETTAYLQATGKL